MPVNNLFICCFDDPERLQASKAAGSSGGYGALEHHHCSFTTCPKLPLKRSCALLFTMLVAMSSCILTPLNIHSKRIEDFDFVAPTMSRHLWLYEGVTEYFSMLCQVQDSLVTEQEFLDMIRQKINESEQFGSFSFTTMSANVLTPENQKLYLSVYNKGAVLAMMLDINIQQLTNGKKSLKSVLQELAIKYGPEKPFDDKLLISEIVFEGTDLQSFFDSYISPVGENGWASRYFLLVWADYQSEKERKVYISGYFGVEYKEATSSFVLVQVRQNIFGFENGDILEAINGEEITMDNFMDIFVAFKYNESLPKSA